MTNFSSKEFIDRVTALDKEAISLLVDSYTDHLFRAGLGSGLSEEMAYDLAASTWTTFLEVVPRFEGRSHIRTFLFGIFYNKLAELRRANLKFQKTDPIEEILESSFEDDGHWNKQFMDPSLLAQNNEIMAIIEQCMEHLPMLQRSAFMMKLVDGEESDFICETLGITDGNLRQLIFRAKAKIRDCIEKNIN
ncbi:sigma-70 family RNA polymerase sigma factor [Bacteriovorax sp. Seq25_V]|uniref:sigma-70 family RNA polymerase sigma factor n=1 Tax=Bacteriovorax sp. Seq25_V TaxID=1201288 RepID=UPI0009FEF953|nr:sigma-70 family RNA polymerase sigma factor [Bacteriovorax sp. Seq25_V]